MVMIINKNLRKELKMFMDSIKDKIIQSQMEMIAHLNTELDERKEYEYKLMDIIGNLMQKIEKIGKENE